MHPLSQKLWGGAQQSVLLQALQVILRLLRFRPLPQRKPQMIVITESHLQGPPSSSWLPAQLAITWLSAFIPFTSINTQLHWGWGGETALPRGVQGSAWHAKPLRELTKLEQDPRTWWLFYPNNLWRSSQWGKIEASLGTTHHTFYRDPNSSILSFRSQACVRQRCLNLWARKGNHLI